MDAAPGSPARPKPDRSLCPCPAGGGHRKADYLQAIADDGEPHLASGIIEAGPHPDRERRTAASGRGPLFVAPGSGRRARRRLAAGPADYRGSVMIKATPIRTAPSAYRRRSRPSGAAEPAHTPSEILCLSALGGELWSARRLMSPTKRRRPALQAMRLTGGHASRAAWQLRRYAIQTSICLPQLKSLTGFHADIEMGGDTRTMRARARAGSTEAWEFCGNRSSARLFQSAFGVESGFMARISTSRSEVGVAPEGGNAPSDAMGTKFTKASWPLCPKASCNSIISRAHTSKRFGEVGSKGSGFTVTASPFESFNEMPAPLLTACRSWVSTRAALPFTVTFHELAAGKSCACIGAVHTLFRPGAKKAVPSGLRVLLNCSL